MKKYLRVLSVLIIVVLLASCKANKANVNSTEEKNSNSTDVKYAEKIENEDQIIDIRSSDKYLGWKNEKGKSGHIEKALDFPSDWLSYEKNNSVLENELKRRHLDLDKKTVIYSDDDVTNEEYDGYKKLGFKDIYVLKGGINQYNGKLEKLQGYEKFVSPQWVQAVIDNKKPDGYNSEKYKIVEVSLPSEKKEYSSGHIKGAINVNTDDINHVPGLRMLDEYETVPMDKQLKFWNFKPDSEIKQEIEKLGIDEDTTVILYATEKATTGAYRTALVMDYFGIKDIRFLNGGKKLWKLEGRELDKTIENPQRTSLKNTEPANKDIIFNYEDELKMVDDKNSVIASVRSWDEYIGKISGYTYIDRAGDIKNARFAYAGSDPYAMEDYRNLDNTMFNYNICQERWKKWGITPDKKVSFHCGTGWRASETYYIAKAIGWKNIGVYDGGWYEWIKRPNSPVKEKGLPSDAPEKQPEEYFIK